MGDNMIFLLIKIFFVRIVDVSLGTFRTILTVKGKRTCASIIGFIEVLIWFLIVREALNTSESGLIVGIAYASGFSVGTYIGGLLSDKFISGTLSVQIILSNNDKRIIDKIREEGFAVSVTNVFGQEYDKQKYMLFMEINKKSYEQLKKLINELDPKAFLVVNETKIVQNGFIK